MVSQSGKFLIVLLAPLLMAQALWQGVTAGGSNDSITIFPNPVTGWDACSSLVVYWPLDEVSGTRSAAHGSCTGCDLSVQQGVTANHGEYCHSAEGLETGDKLTCNSSSACDELAPTSDFSITGWHKAADDDNTSSSSVAHYSIDHFKGYAVFPYHSGLINDVSFFINAKPNIVDNAADTDVFTFFMASWDEASDVSRLCAAGPPIQDRSATWNACADETSVSGPIGYGSGPLATEFAISRVVDDNPIYTDEVAIWDVLLTDPEWCFICSCRIDGTACGHIDTTFVNKGINESHCGGCTMPSVSSAGVVACPS